MTRKKHPPHAPVSCIRDNSLTGLTVRFVCPTCGRETNILLTIC